MATDNISFKRIATFYDIRELLKCKLSSQNIPSSVNKIKDLVMKLAQIIRLHISNEITKVIKDGERLSLAMYEWTSIAMRTYFNLAIF
jgi:hypothetical protein